MERVWQEFYCNDCHGYIRLKLNMVLNYSVVVVCPNCDRKHPRVIKDGRIYEGGNGRTADEICPPKAAYSKEAFSKHIRVNARDAEVISSSQDVNERHPAAQQILNERWFELYGDRARKVSG